MPPHGKEAVTLCQKYEAGLHGIEDDSPCHIYGYRQRWLAEYRIDRS
jgi:hypothetical protein